MSARTDLAQVIGSTLRAEGFLYATRSVCDAVAAAIIDRPGLIRALAVGDTNGDPVLESMSKVIDPQTGTPLIMDETGLPIGKRGVAAD